MTSQLTAAPDQRRALGLARELARPHRRWFVGGAAATVASTLGELAGPVLVGRAVDAVLARDRGGLRLTVGFLAVLALVRYGTEQVRRRLLAGAGERFLADLRAAVTVALLTRPGALADTDPPGELIARGTKDVDAVASFVRDGARQLIDGFLLLGLTAVVLVTTAWPLALVALAYLPGLVLALHRFGRATTPAFAAFDQRQADVTARAAETLAGREALQAAGAEKRWAARTAAVDRALLRAYDDSLRAENRLSVLGCWQSITLALVLVAGAVLADRAVLTIGTVTTAVLIVRQLFGPLDSLLWFYGESRSARSNLARVRQLTGDQPSCRLPAAAPAAPGTARRGDLVVAGVRFGYDPDGPPVLDGVDLRIAPGEHLAVVGSSGAGKSTLARLVAGLIEPDAGTVTLGGDPVVAAPGAPRRVVLVPQDGHVLAGTLAENLRLVPGDHDDAELAAVVRRCGLSGWVDSLPGGLHTGLEDRGVNLSAGERQLVALLRAALAEPEVLVLDEATADLDPATEALVAGAIGRIGLGRILIVVAHRQATAARYRRIVRVEHGRVR